MVQNKNIAGSILWPKFCSDNRTGQLILPIWGKNPIMLIQKELYQSNDEEDCQSDTIQDWRWLVLHEGSILWLTEYILEQFFEYR